MPSKDGVMESAGRPRRLLALLSSFGVTSLQRQNPYIVAWWSAAFPGFGHLLLQQYIRGVLLTLSEVITNTLAHINEAIVYSFSGRYLMAREVLDPVWLYGYCVIYLYAIWDSYRSTLETNRQCELAEIENARLQTMVLRPVTIQYLERKSPRAAAAASFFFPGLGQLYNHRVGLAFYAMIWWWVYLYLSNLHASLLALLLGHPAESAAMLRPHWLLFMPSVMCGSIYHAYVTAVEHNRLFRVEQRQYLKERYPAAGFKILP
ncbi:hypothetical protein [Paenibacillus mucilaginosus]|uniref:Uncharacterized protein n=1 Tax=Paenibacillus mucilaginosus (strain KNP414) TaxID=1036673 RepID=F8FMB6_PAEMK|nr:hypothetical protein [Paenibacillus mucilaginosus]AEI38924.1 hypothetical protein KNP414_00299 [Paenibacillus mucilaginosus KNP414]MCG7216549.1 hypothetical protein [Paenibacillus mucilaginosus]WDM27978.1 hypothetical protein KCX80_01460 [Paenibacillus mucilaginosus]